MKTKSTSRLSRVNFLFVLTTAFIALCLFVPVWQSAVSAQLRNALQKQEIQVNTMEDQKITLRAYVESQKTPEYVTRMASAKNIVFSQISAESSSAVASSF